MFFETAESKRAAQHLLRFSFGFIYGEDEFEKERNYLLGTREEKNIYPCVAGSLTFFNASILVGFPIAISPPTVYIARYKI